eukprot:TRINITY_DN3292_c0_g1_i1.p1 TRINITY_DN3292_c0_g1~~TRINITY_DN3292_c0_g1_i1.p1  ORF type:complete len:1141 (+),score=200.87 TRINITY_DN3292_c0_g1_i1:35-3424(+)
MRRRTNVALESPDDTEGTTDPIDREFSMAFADTPRLQQLVAGTRETFADLVTDSTDGVTTVAQQLQMIVVSHSSALRRIFERVDKEAKGGVGPAEFADAMERFGIPGELADDLFVFYDIDGDGKVDYAEFLKTVFDFGIQSDEEKSRMDQAKKEFLRREEQNLVHLNKIGQRKLQRLQEETQKLSSELNTNASLTESQRQIMQNKQAVVKERVQQTCFRLRLLEQYQARLPSEQRSEPGGASPQTVPESLSAYNKRLILKKAEIFRKQAERTQALRELEEKIRDIDVEIKELDSLCEEEGVSSATRLQLMERKLQLLQNKAEADKALIEVRHAPTGSLNEAERVALRALRALHQLHSANAPVTEDEAQQRRQQAIRVIAETRAKAETRRRATEKIRELLTLHSPSSSSKLELGDTVLRHLPFFSPLFSDSADQEKEEFFHELVIALSPKLFTTGSKIASPGDPDDALTFVWRGSVELRDELGRSSATLQLTSGDLFGELSMIDATAVHTSAIFATSETILLRLPREAFEDVCARFPAAAKLLLQAGRDRVTGMLQDTLARPTERHALEEERERLVQKLVALLSSQALSLRQIFERYDIDRDNHWDRSEFALMLQELGMDAEISDVLYDLYDSNNDGTIDYEELVQAFGKGMDAVRAQAVLLREARAKQTEIRTRREELESRRTDVQGRRNKLVLELEAIDAALATGQLQLMPPTEEFELMKRKMQFLEQLDRLERENKAVTRRISMLPSLSSEEKRLLRGQEALARSRRQSTKPTEQPAQELVPKPPSAPKPEALQQQARQRQARLQQLDAQTEDTKKRLAELQGKIDFCDAQIGDLPDGVERLEAMQAKVQLLQTKQELELQLGDLQAQRVPLKPEEKQALRSLQALKDLVSVRQKEENFKLEFEKKYAAMQALRASNKHRKPQRNSIHATQAPDVRPPKPVISPRPLPLEKTNQHIKTLLRLVPVFASAVQDEGFADDLASQLKPRTAHPGEVILKQGDRSREVYFVTSGELSVTTRDPKGNPAEVARLRFGDCFGELALLTGSPRMATVTALTECSLLCLQRLSFDGLAARYPGCARQVVDAGAVRLVQLLRSNTTQAAQQRVRKSDSGPQLPKLGAKDRSPRTAR